MKAEFVTFICSIFIGQKPVIRVRMIAPWEPGLKATFHAETLNSEFPCADRMCAPEDSERQISKRTQHDSTWLCCAYMFQDSLQVTDIFLSLSGYFSPRGPEAELAKQIGRQYVENSPMPGEGIRGQWGRHFIHLNEPHYWILPTCECFTHIFFL